MLLDLKDGKGVIAHLAKVIINWSICELWEYEDTIYYLSRRDNAELWKGWDYIEHDNAVWRKVQVEESKHHH